MSRGVPILREHNQVEGVVGSDPVDHWDHFLTARHSEAAVRKEIELHIYHQESSLLGIGQQTKRESKEHSKDCPNAG